MNKLCKDCKWSEDRPSEVDLLCNSPRVNRWNWNYVSAKIPSNQCRYAHTVRRNLLSSCGILGRYWEPRENLIVGP